MVTRPLFERNVRRIEQWPALLASRLLGLEDLRQRVWELGQRHGTPVWVSEIDGKNQFRGTHLDYIQIACLKQVRSVEKVICLLDGSFGTTWNEAQTSILELELATAAFSRRDIWIYLLAPFDNPDRRILTLLDAIRVACPSARIRGPLSHDRALDHIARILDPASATPETLSVGHLVQGCAITRSPALNHHLSMRDVQFLNGVATPLLDEAPDRAVVERLISRAERQTVTPDKLAQLWVAIRHLSAVPFSDRRCEEYLPLWEKTLTRWASASAWYGLHGHFFLGRLAALNSLSRIRQRMPAPMRKTLGSPSIYADAGAAASEYYSIAKLVPSRLLRHRLLSKALWNCNAAIDDGAAFDPSGLLDIRGHVKLQMLNPIGGIADLKRSLAMRCEQAQRLDRIGESEVHLGRAYAHCRLHRKAERLLQDGVAKLRMTENRDFLTQALRHLADFYTRVGQHSEAVKSLREAQRIALEGETAGQLQQIADELHKLGEDG